MMKTMKTKKLLSILLTLTMLLALATTACADGDKWSEELTADGTGSCQLVATKDAVIARTKTYDTTVGKGLIQTVFPEEEEEPPAEEPQDEEPQDEEP